MNLIKYCIECLQLAASTKALGNVYIKDKGLSYNSYCDNNGQRQAYIEHFGYGEPLPDKYPTMFLIKRHLSFTNEEDKGLEGACLATLSVKDLSDKDHIVITNNSITINSFQFIFYKENLFVTENKIQ